MTAVNRARTAQIMFRVTPAVKKEIHERARSAPSLAEYLEGVALQGPPAIDRADLLAALHALRSIRDNMRPASTIDVRRALYELTRLGNLQKHLYSEAKVPIDRIDKVAFHLRDAITRTEEAVAAAVTPPADGYTAQVLVRLEAAIETIIDALGHRPR